MSSNQEKKCPKCGKRIRPSSFSGDPCPGSICISTGGSGEGDAIACCIILGVCIVFGTCIFAYYKCTEDTDYCTCPLVDDDDDESTELVPVEGSSGTTTQNET
jgi:hypothetical protein